MRTSECSGKLQEQNDGDGVGDDDESNGGLAAPDDSSGINRFMEEVDSGILRRGKHLRSHNPANMPSSILFLACVQFLRLPSVSSALSSSAYKSGPAYKFEKGTSAVQLANCSPFASNLLSSKGGRVST